MREVNRRFGAAGGRAPRRPFRFRVKDGVRSDEELFLREIKEIIANTSDV
jgi:hypothetical protein